MSPSRGLALSALLLAATAHARRKNADPSLITLPCSWETGAEFHYRFERERTDSQKPLMAQVRTTTPVTIRVTGPNTFSYDAGLPVFEGPPEVRAALQSSIAGFDAPPMELLMEDGTVTGIANYPAFFAQLEPMLLNMLVGTPPEALEGTLALFRDPSTGAALFLKEPGMLFTMHCTQMSPGQRLESPTSYPNPLGGPPLTSLSSIAMTRHDATAEVVVFETRDQTDPESIRAALPSLFAKLAPGAVPDPAAMEQALAELPPIESLMVGTMVYSTVDGFPLRVEVRQEVGASTHPSRRTDTRIWTRVEAPPSSP